MIDKLFLYFKSETAFQEALGFNKIKNDSVVFIEDKRAVWTHGHMFGIENSHAKGFFSSVDALPSGEPGDWAIVKGDESSWYIYYYDSAEKRWVQGEIYEVTSLQGNLDDVYVKKEDIFKLIGNLYDNIYVRKDEVYTPDQWENTSGTDTPGTTPGGGGVLNVDFELNNHSLNPVANWVIYDALKLKLSKGELDEALENYYTKALINAKLALLTPNNPGGIIPDWITEEMYNELIDKFKYYYTKSQLSDYLSDKYYTKQQTNDSFVKQSNLNAYIKSYCDNIYVRQDKVYTPAGWGGSTAGGDDSGSTNPNTGGGGSYVVDFTINNSSSNPVANWVIYEALNNKVDTDTLVGYLKTEDLADTILNNSLLISDINAPVKQYVQGYAYTKEQIDTLLNNIEKMSFKVVSSLAYVPNPNSSTIYLLEDNGQYIQYIYDNGWIEIGVYEIDIDFTDYYTKEEIETRLASLTNVADFYTKRYIDNQFENVSNRFEQYYTKQQIDRDVVKKDDVYTTSDGFGVVSGHDTPGSSSGTGSFGPKHIILTESEYAQLSSYEVDAIYFVTEDVIENTTWTFGGTFPVIFTNGDTLDNIGTFPINLA